MCLLGSSCTLPNRVRGLCPKTSVPRHHQVLTEAQAPSLSDTALEIERRTRIELWRAER